MAIGEQFDLDKLCIICEDIILCSIPQQSIVDSIVDLLSSSYIFNMVYKDSKTNLIFPRAGPDGYWPRPYFAECQHFL